MLAVILINIGLLTLLKGFFPHGNLSSNKILHVKRAALVEVEQRTYKSRLAQLPFSAVAGNTPSPVSPPPWLWSPEGPHFPGSLGPWPLTVHRADLSPRPALIGVAVTLSDGLLSVGQKIKKKRSYLSKVFPISAFSRILCSPGWTSPSFWPLLAENGSRSSSDSSPYPGQVKNSSML